MGAAFILSASAFVWILAATASSRAKPSATLKGVYPIHFTNLTATAYVFTNIYTLTYTESLPPIDESAVDNVFSKPKLCLSRWSYGYGSACQELSENLTTIERVVKSMVKRESGSLRFEVSKNIGMNDDVHVRRKRFLIPALAMGAVVGVAGAVSTKIFCDLPLIDDLSRNFNSFVEDVRNPKLRQFMNDTAKFQYDTLKNAAEIANKRLEETAAILLEEEDRASIRSSMRNFVTFTILRAQRIQDACNRGVIPSNVVDEMTLLSDLRTIQEDHETIGMELAIPIDHVQDYYKLRICTCEYREGTVVINIHLPMKPKDAEYELYSPTYLPFKFGNEICAVRSVDALLVQNKMNQHVRVLTGQNLRDCDVSTHLCKVQPYSNADIESVCLQETFNEKPIEELRKHCFFGCAALAENTPLINRIRPEEYVITNAPRPIYIEDSEGQRTEISIPDLDGAFRLTLPCSSALIHTPPNEMVVVLIDEITCNDENGNRTHHLEPIVPLQWLSNRSQDSGPALDLRWKNMTPNYSFLTRAELEEQLLKIARNAEEESNFFAKLLKLLTPDLKEKLFYLSLLFNAFVMCAVYQRMRVLASKLLRLETALIMRNTQPSVRDASNSV